MYYKVKRTSTFNEQLHNILEYLNTEKVSKKIILNIYSEILGTLKSLDFMPQRYAEFYKCYRRTLVRKYSIFYKIDEIKKEVKIYTILHQSQDFTKYLK